jgi:glycosyltransferase involved in cell wall biosynthesis
VVGIGVDDPAPTDVRAFRQRFGLGSGPYLCCVGRVDEAKGATELLEYFAAYKARHTDDLKLVLVGESVMDLPSLADVIRLAMSTTRCATRRSRVRSRSCTRRTSRASRWC